MIATLQFTLPLHESDDITSWYVGHGDTDMDALFAVANVFYHGTFGHELFDTRSFIDRSLNYQWGDATNIRQNNLWCSIRRAFETVTFRDTEYVDLLDLLDEVSQQLPTPKQQNFMSDLIWESRHPTTLLH